ncbi:MAG: hypothetical protein RL748_1805, partial [Pseudomonadota bacterium]
MARKEIIEQLRQLPIEASAAFGLRVGLRVLPWLAIEQGLFRGVKSQEDRARYLYSVFAAFDVGLMAVLERRASGLNSVAQKRRMEVKTVATTATSDTNNNSLTDVDIIGLAYAVAAYATGNPISVRTSDTAVADIVSYAATYAYDDVISEFNLQIKHDLAFLGKDRAIKLIESPIWENTPPAPWVMQSQQFRLAVGQFGNGFVFWLEWYDALCRGDTIDTGQ